MNREQLADSGPQAFGRREPFADKANALGPWIEAMAALTPWVETDDACGAACCAREPEVPSLLLPEGAPGQAFRESVAANRRALELIDAGIDRGRFQFPEPKGPDSFITDMGPVQALRDLVRLRNRYTRVLASDGEVAAAAQLLRRSLAMAEMVFDGGGYVIHYLVAMGLKGIVTAAIRALAFTAGAPPEEMQQLLAALESGQGVSRWIDAVWRDLEFWSLPIFDRLAAAETLDQLVDALLECCYSTKPLMLDDDTPPVLDDRNAWRRERIVDLLEGHPAPFDKAETLRMASDALAAAVRDSQVTPAVSSTPLTPRGEASGPLLPDGAWPAHLSAGLLYEYIGHSPAAIKAREEAKDFMSPERLVEIEPPSDAALAAARTKLHALSNPVGRMLVATGACLPTIPGGPVRFTNEAHTLAAKVCLAIRLYFNCFGRAPQELSDLAAAGLLPETPLDPFDRQPLRYSRERGLIWSIGFDGIDGHGDPAGDLVWRVPLGGEERRHSSHVA